MVVTGRMRDRRIDPSAERQNGPVLVRRLDALYGMVEKAMTDTSMRARTCSFDSPWTKERAATEGERGWCHLSAHEVGEQEDGYPGGDIIRVKCPACGLEWKEELPQ